MANLLKEQLNHCLALCRDSLPDCVTLDYIDYDHDLYRFIHKIDYEKEEEILKAQHPGYAESQNVKKSDIIGVRKVFNDTEEIRKIDNPDDYAVILKAGLTIREGIQEQQDSFIRINVLSGTDIWPVPNMKVIEKMKRLLEECPDLPFLY